MFCCVLQVVRFFKAAINEGWKWETETILLRFFVVSAVKRQRRKFQTPYGAIETLLAFSVNFGLNQTKNCLYLNSFLIPKFVRTASSCSRFFRSSLNARALAAVQKLLTMNNDSMPRTKFFSIIQTSAAQTRISGDVRVRKNPQTLVGLKTNKNRLRV